MGKTAKQAPSDANTTYEWCGFTFRRGERDMLWVSKDGMNPMPGACCFSTPEQARKGIAALILADAITGKTQHPQHGDVFWALIELTR